MIIRLVRRFGHIQWPLLILYDPAAFNLLSGILDGQPHLVESHIICNDNVDFLALDGSVDGLNIWESCNSGSHGRGTASDTKSVRSGTFYVARNAHLHRTSARRTRRSGPF